MRAGAPRAARGQKYRFGGVLVAALLAGGCASTAGIAPQAAPVDVNALEASKSFAGAKLSPAAWPRTDWWKRFNDPQLDRLMEEAFAGSPALRVARARARKAMALAQLADAQRHPEINGRGTATRQRFPEHGLIPPPFGGMWETQAQLQATIDYDVDLWGRNRAAYASAIGAAHAAEIDAFAARLALSTAIAQAYVALDHAFRQLDIAQQTLAERQQLYQLTLKRFDAGIDTRLAVKQAEAALPATREQIVQLHEAIDITRGELATLVGKGPDRGLAITRPVLDVPREAAIPTVIPAALIGRRPDIVAQRWRVESARRDIDVAKAAFYPNVNLAAFIGFQSLGLSRLLEAGSRTLGAGPAVTLPIFEGGRLRAGLAAADADYDVAVERYNQTLIEALKEVVDQLTVYRSLEAQRVEQRRAQATAQEAYDLALLRFREGVGTYLEVLTAESQLLAQRGLDADLLARRLGVSVKLARALGGGFDGAAMPAIAQGVR